MGAIVGGVVGASLVIIISVLVLVIVIVMIKVSCRTGKPDGNALVYNYYEMLLLTLNIIESGTLQLNILPIEVKLKLEPLVGRSFMKIDIEKDCTLWEAIEYHPKNLKFKRGHAYYEFVHGKENVSEDKELIFINKVEHYNCTMVPMLGGKMHFCNIISQNTGKCFSPNVALSVLYENDLLGEGVQKPGYKNYQLFVQSTGSGARHLPAKSVLLYEKVQFAEQYYRIIPEAMRFSNRGCGYGMLDIA